MPLRPTLRSEFERAERLVAANARLKAEIERLTAQVAGLREEWTVKHSQGIHPGPFTEQGARAWIAESIKHDDRRQRVARGQQRLLRRYVTEWEEVVD